MDIPEFSAKKAKATIWFMILFNKVEAKIFDSKENYFITSRDDLTQEGIEIIGTIKRGKTNYKIFKKI